MKNTRKPNFLLLATLGAGILGMYLRFWLYATGIDSAGLLRTDHIAHVLIFILTAIVLAVQFVALRNTDGMLAYRKLFPKSISAFLGCLAAAAGILTSAIAEYLAKPDDRVILLSCILGVLAAISLLVIGFSRLQQKRPFYLFHALVTAYLMLHLISQYRSWSAQTQLQDYFFQLLGSVFLMLASYYRTLLDAGFSHRRRYCQFQYGALFCCCLCVVHGDRFFYLSMGVWMATAGCSLASPAPKVAMQLPKNVLYCIRALEDAGYSAYAVGGCVRDALLGLTPQDYDLCTNATPEQIISAFSHHPLVCNGQKHGTIGVVLEGQVYEITTFRTEGGYSDNRHPDWVEYVSNIKQDLARRDFTVNAIAYSPTSGYIDPWGGRADLKKGILRAVGEPEIRFREDALRILRGVRFAIRYSLTVEENTRQAMIKCAPLMDQLARERVFAELCKLLPLAKAQDLLDHAPILTQIIPELAPTVGFDQHSSHHDHDIYTHTAMTVEAIPPALPLRLAALLHDIGKVSTFTLDADGQGHFYSHAKVGAEMADTILQRLKAPTALREQVVFLIAQHMTPLEPDKKLLRRRLSKWGEGNIRRLLLLQQADRGKDPEEIYLHYFTAIEQLLNEVLQEDSCLHIRDLAINGNDLISFGFSGPDIGKGLDFLLGKILDEALPNDRDILLGYAQTKLREEIQ